MWWHDVVDSASPEHSAEAFDAEHPLFLLYTSGTTGKPKGIVHTSGGYLTQASYTHYNVFDIKPETDVFWCTADIGWVTGHTYGVYGPLSNGVTQVIYEGTPSTPSQHRHFEIIEKYGVTIYYTAPTMIRTFMKWGREIPDAHDLSSLRLLGTVGEPINPEAWRWYRKVIGADSIPIVDTWWQTETGAAMISPLPGVAAAKPGSAMRPLPGISARIVDDDGNQLSPPSTDEGEHVTGYLVLDQPWPSMLRGIWGDPDRFRETYWSKFAEQGWYFAGDGARYDSDGAIWILGRIDDVMNVSGHRISTAEVESALVGHSGVAEAAVVGATDETTGQAICAFVVLQASHAETTGAEIIDELRAEVARVISPIARPRELHVVPELPKTRSGKIMRRLLRDIAEKRELGDTSTLLDPGVFDAIRAARPPSSLASGGDGHEARAGTILGVEVGQYRVDRLHHRRRVQRNVLDDADRQVLAEGAVDHADQEIVDGHRGARVTRLSAHLHDDGARVLTRAPRDAARVAGGAALLAGDLTEGRVRSDAVDREAAEVGDRYHLGLVELDDRVVEIVVAGHHGSQRAAVLCRLDDHRRARPAAVRRRETDQLALAVGADGGQGAQGVAVDDDACPAAERDVGRQLVRAPPGRPTGATMSNAATTAEQPTARGLHCDTPVDK